MTNKRTEWKRRAQEQGRVRRVSVEFYGEDLELYEHAAKQGPRATYIKGLIRADMERSGDAGV